MGNIHTPRYIHSHLKGVPTKPLRPPCRPMCLVKRRMREQGCVHQRQYSRPHARNRWRGGLQWVCQGSAEDFAAHCKFVFSVAPGSQNAGCQRTRGASRGRCAPQSRSQRSGYCAQCGRGQGADSTVDIEPCISRDRGELLHNGSHPSLSCFGNYMACRGIVCLSRSGCGTFRGELNSPIPTGSGRCARRGSARGVIH
jgi:hypothetical protein